MSSQLNFSTHPRDARSIIRQGAMFGVTSSGICGGYLQANITVLPLELARDFTEFCRLNSAPCPVLYISNPGEVEAPPLAQDSDIRSDVSKYHVVKNGQLVSEPGDLIDQNWCNFVTFYLGCSFTFEKFLLEADIPVQHIEFGRNVPMFKTNIQCHPVGQFACPMIVSLRPIPRRLVEKAVQITHRCEAVHGAPIHIGDPSKIGLADIYKVQFGENVVEIKEDDIPVFWACGVTGSMATQAAAPDIAFNHSPGCMFICDVKVNDYIENHPPQNRNLIPKVVFIQEYPVPMGTVISETALNKIQNILKQAEDHLGIAEDCAKAINSLSFTKHLLHVSHSHSVTLVITNLQLDEGFVGIVSLIGTLKILDKNVSFRLSNAGDGVVSAFQSCVKQGIIPGDVTMKDLSSSDSCKEDGYRLISIECKKSDSDVVILSLFDTERFEEDVNHTGRDDSFRLIPSVFSDLGGFLLTVGLYHARTCPLHDRYIRKGIGFPEQWKFPFLSNEFYQVIRSTGLKEDPISRAKEFLTHLL